MLQGLFGSFELGPLLGLAQGPLNRRRQPGEPVLQNVVGRAVSEGFDGRFLPQSAGDEDEGNGGVPLSDDGQGRHSVEAGQGEIGEDQVEVIFLQGCEEILPGVNDPYVAAESLCIKGRLDEFGILRVVLEMKDMQVLPSFHPASWELPRWAVH